MGQRRVTVRDAATYLGISESAVRNRLSRGTLESIREGGVTYVVLEDVTHDIPPTDAATDYRDELIQVLREQLGAEREARRRADHIIAALTERIPELEAPPQSPEEATEAAESASEGTSREEAAAEHAEQLSTSPDTGSGRPRRSWWRRISGWVRE